MTPHQLSRHAAIFSGFILSMMISGPIIGVLVFLAAPDIQARCCKVIKGDVNHVVRSGDDVVWDMTLHKNYDAKPLGQYWYVVTGTNQRIPINAYRCDPDWVQHNRALIDHKAGESWSVIYCTLITPDLENTAGIHIEGTASYVGLLSGEITQKMGDFTVPSAGPPP